MRLVVIINLGNFKCPCSQLMFLHRISHDGHCLKPLSNIIYQKVFKTNNPWFVVLSGLVAPYLQRFKAFQKVLSTNLHSQGQKTKLTVKMQMCLLPNEKVRNRTINLYDALLFFKLYNLSPLYQKHISVTLISPC